ncbi:hypothetical protein SSTU70S_02803 [Stutzerimonas stutzeri]
MQLREGLSLHWSDYQELQDFVAENPVQPRLSFVLFLDGQSEVNYGDLALSFGQADRRQRPQGVALAMTEPVLFRRQARRGRHIRKLLVQIWRRNGSTTPAPRPAARCGASCRAIWRRVCGSRRHGC